MPYNEIIERNRTAMRRFEECINTNNLTLGEELISANAAFTTPFSSSPLYGAKGYLSIVEFMRQSFPDVHWTLENMVADETTIAVQWRCTGTFSGTAMENTSCAGRTSPRRKSMAMIRSDSCMIGSATDSKQLTAMVFFRIRSMVWE